MPISSQAFKNAPLAVAANYNLRIPNQQINAMQITGDQQLLKEINRMGILYHVFEHPDVSRADLAQALGLTKSTIGLLVRELVHEGWLKEQDMLVTGNLGRRPTPLHINPHHLVLLGADVSIDHIRIVACNLSGKIISQKTIAHANINDAAKCIAALADGFMRMATRMMTEGREIAGIGVGLPGGVDESTGVLLIAPNLGWRDVPVQALLRAHFSTTILGKIPLYIQNEADVAALGELEFASRRESNPLVYVSVGYGVGAGVVANDRLLTGHRGFAGEIGHTILALNGPLCSCGRHGCAEAMIGLKSLLHDTAVDTSGGTSKALAQISAQLAQQDADTIKAVETKGRHLGVLLHNLWAAYDPARIVLGGGAIVHLGDIFLQAAQQVFASYAQAAQLEPLSIQISRYGDNAVAVGAAALARYRLTRPLLSASKVDSDAVLLAIEPSVKPSKSRKKPADRIQQALAA
jgi:predicted NBD/HSP70 family sugar kinase